MVLKRKNVIVLTSNEVLVVRGNFKKLCDEFKFPYHSLKMLKFPILYKDFVIHKVEFKQRLTDGVYGKWWKSTPKYFD